MACSSPPSPLLSCGASPSSIRAAARGVFMWVFCLLELARGILNVFDVVFTRSRRQAAASCCHWWRQHHHPAADGSRRGHHRQPASHEYLRAHRQQHEVSAPSHTNKQTHQLVYVLGFEVHALIRAWFSIHVQALSPPRGRRGWQLAAEEERSSSGESTLSPPRAFFDH